MKRVLLCLLLTLTMLLSGCGTPSSKTDPDVLQVAATTYPVYLLTEAVTEDIPNVDVRLIVDQEISCLHNYTLTMRDMVAVEQADVLVLNGAGMEEFLSDVLRDRVCIDSSAGMTLITPDDGAHQHDHGAEEAEPDHHAHDHAQEEAHEHNEEQEQKHEEEHSSAHSGHHHHEHDPHIWMDPLRAIQMADNIAEGLSEIDPEHADAFAKNAEEIRENLTAFHAEMQTKLGDKHYDLITFHDGFTYFADSFGMHILAAVEEEEGSEASAAAIVHISELVQEHHLPAVFTEVNGSDATANVIARECDIKTYPLSMGMSGDGHGLSAYMDIIRSDIETIMEAYQ